MLDHYLHTARRAHRVLYPGRQLIDLDSAARPGDPGDVRRQGVRAGLAAKPSTRCSSRSSTWPPADGFDAHAWRLPWCCGPSSTCAGTGTTARGCTAPRSRPRGAAATCPARRTCCAGSASFEMSLGDYAQAHRCLAAAQGLFRQLGDTLGLARTDVIISQALEFQGRHAEALAVVRRSAAAVRDRAGRPVHAAGRASALNGSAWNSVQLGELARPARYCTQAIELCQSIGYSPGEAGTWDTLGVVWQRLGDHAEAVPCFLRAVTLDREMGNRFDLAMALAHLGETYAVHR